MGWDYTFLETSCAFLVVWKPFNSPYGLCHFQRSKHPIQPHLSLILAISKTVSLFGNVGFEKYVHFAIFECFVYGRVAFALKEEAFLRP